MCAWTCSCLNIPIIFSADLCTPPLLFSLSLFHSCSSLLYCSALQTIKTQAHNSSAQGQHFFHTLLNLKASLNTKLRLYEDFSLFPLFKYWSTELICMQCKQVKIDPDNYLLLNLLSLSHNHERIKTLKFSRNAFFLTSWPIS